MCEGCQGENGRLLRVFPQAACRRACCALPSFHRSVQQHDQLGGLQQKLPRRCLSLFPCRVLCIRARVRLTWHRSALPRTIRRENPRRPPCPYLFPSPLVLGILRAAQGAVGCSYVHIGMWREVERSKRRQHGHGLNHNRATLKTIATEGCEHLIINTQSGLEQCPCCIFSNPASACAQLLARYPRRLARTHLPEIGADDGDEDVDGRQLEGTCSVELLPLSALPSNMHMSSLLLQAHRHNIEGARRRANTSATRVLPARHSTLELADKACAHAQNTEQRLGT